MSDRAVTSAPPEVDRVAASRAAVAARRARAAVKHDIATGARSPLDVLRAAFEVAGSRIEAEYAFVGRGLPRQTVTVPAGTFSVTPVQLDVTVSIGGGAAASIAMTSTYYLDDAIGLVRSTFSSDALGSGSTDLVRCSLL